jgi:hypothetical protein
MYKRIFKKLDIAFREANSLFIYFRLYMNFRLYFWAGQVLEFLLVAI